MVLATHLRSRRLRHLSILIVAVTTATTNSSILAQDDSAPYGVQPVVVSPAEQIPSIKIPGELVKLKPILDGPITSESTDDQSPEAGSEQIPVPILPAMPTPFVLSEEAVESSNPEDNEYGGKIEHRSSPTRSGVTVPVLMASDKAAKSTLELKPVAGPLFGRGRLFKQGLFRSSDRNEKTAETETNVGKYNPAIPKPPAYIPNAPATTPRSAQMQRSAPQQMVQPQRRYQDAAQGQRTQSDSNLRWSSPDRNVQAPLRDAATETVPEYANAPHSTPRSTPQRMPLRQPTPVPSLQQAAPAEMARDKTPPDVSVPSVQLNPQKRAEPILVSPTAPKRIGASSTAADSIERQVPSAEVKSVTKKSASKNRESIAEHMRRDKQTELSADRQDAQRQRNATIQQRTAAAPQRTATTPQRTTNTRDAAKQPEASVASRSRQQRPAPAQARVSDETTARPNLDYVGFPATPIRVQAATQRLKPSMERTLQYFYDNSEIASGRSNWGMMHAIMVYGVDTRLRVGNRHYSTIAWIAGNNICRGQRLLTHDASGIKVKSGIGLQGHQAQMLAIFSLCDVPADYPLYAGDMQYSMQNVIEAEKRDCKSGEELTFTLIGLSHYLDTDATWIAGDGQRWDFERLIREELSQSIVGTACGGTHRLMGFAHALRNRRHEGKPITGQWARAEQFVRDFISYTYTLQNRDGSMSTNWFEGRGDNGDVDRKIQTTGHMVELLLTVTPDSQLQDPRLFRAVRFLAVSMNNDLGREWKIGPKGHALRSLMMYHDRVFKSGPAWRTQSTMARNPDGTIYR